MSPEVNRPILALEIGPLSERHYTGIANVAKHLAAEILKDETVEGRFFFNRQEISAAVVQRLIDLEGGSILRWLVQRALFPSVYSSALDRTIIGIFTNHKTHRRLFPFEVQIIHDLTTLITPQYHNRDNINFGNAHRFGDAASSDLIVAVSESTRTDLLTYYPKLAHIPCIVAPLASCASRDVTLPFGTTVEPYVLVLGTLEPRKNIEFVFEFLSTHPSLLERIPFVFVGRWGWGRSAQDLIIHYRLAQYVENGSIRFTGFVCDEVRDYLLAYARCVVYASRYEGFGLPVLEALSYGVAVVTGHGSSLPEAGGLFATYCDVGSTSSFGDALLRSIEDNGETATAARRKWADSFSWTKTYQTIKDASLSLARSQEQK
jgi:glycosyltransferase involved in cell wall biosynthesis